MVMIDQENIQEIEQLIHWILVNMDNDGQKYFYADRCLVDQNELFLESINIW